MAKLATVRYATDKNSEYFLILHKITKTLYSINWPNVLVWLPSLLEIVGNMCIVIFCSPVYDMINVEMNLGFLIKPFLYKIKNLNRTKFKYLKNKRNFSDEIKSIYHNFNFFHHFFIIIFIEDNKLFFGRQESSFGFKDDCSYHWHSGKNVTTNWW